jgi:hypothetical protein
MRVECWKEHRPRLNEYVDLSTVVGMAEVCPAGMHIFVTGESSLDTLGQIAAQGIMHWNTVAKDPLFTYTDYNSIRMTRYDFHDVWNYLMTGGQEGRNLLIKHMAEEAKRLGFTDLTYKLNGDDGSLPKNYLYGLFDSAQLLGKIVLCEDEAQFMYVNGVTLFGKPRFLDIPIHTFFSAFSFKGLKNRILTEAENDERSKAFHREVERLHFAEEDYLLDLFQKINK